MSKYRRIPKVIEIEAVQWNGSMKEIKALVGNDLPTHGPPGLSGSLRVVDSQGDMECRLGDWVVKDGNGDIWVCHNELFHLFYELVTDE